MNPSASDSDAALVLAAAAGDVAAFGELFGALGPGAWSFARRLAKDEAAAEDAVHDAFLRLFEAARRGVFSPARGTARALLFRMVRNACIDERRAKAREATSYEDDLHDRASEDGTPALRLGLDAAAELRGLPPPWRSALVLRIDQGLSYDEIAEALEATTTQVKTWIFRARTALAARLDVSAAAEGGRRDV